MNEEAKDKIINIRVDNETQQAIKDAAEAQGLSMTSFILNVAKREALRKRPKQTATPPSFFRALIFEAQRGGSRGYEDAGYHLAMHAHEFLSYEYDSDEEIAAMDRLESRLSKGDDDGILRWFEEELPKVMKLVPARRRDQFLKGVWAAWEEGRIGG
jgi:hypothetical protein